MQDILFMFDRLSMQQAWILSRNDQTGAASVNILSTCNSNVAIVFKCLEFLFGTMRYANRMVVCLDQAILKREVCIPSQIQSSSHVQIAASRLQLKRVHNYTAEYLLGYIDALTNNRVALKWIFSIAIGSTSKTK